MCAKADVARKPIRFRQIDEDVLAAIGLDISDPEVNKENSIKVQDILNTRVTRVLKNTLSFDLLAELGEKQQAGVDVDMTDWLSNSVPNYKGIVLRELNDLVDELHQKTENLLRSV